MTQDPVARWGRAGALYDFVASISFVTPWTAALALDLLGTPHTSETLLFATLFGTVVVMWSIVRWLRPQPLLIAADTAGRALFSVWFTWALLQGHTPALAGFLVLELFWGAAQLRALLRR
ncbi:hypothetical protein [Lentzea sp. HUAS12]|uniref:hypothetical protein n=1 Tax=Lentzea sp. HUAS12 TaxID=2951806 RepID=UPI00209D1180|nr:hypothetical protein [Lentzea sp. HUAS12]USX48975.1 hypothetical protein ND450_26360 [Lentzea sp. HUAS12]